MAGKRLWIAWERQRRSVELAECFNCQLCIIEHNGMFRYVRSIAETLKILTQQKPEMLFVQNPSMVLAALACLYGKAVGLPVVVDRHSTFMLSRAYRKTPRIILFRFLHKLTIFMAHLTIVTNNYLAEIVEEIGGRAFVLPDKLPRLDKSERLSLKGTSNLLLISSFGLDEPIEAVLSAMKQHEEAGTHLYITGNDSKLDERVKDKAPANVTFTGFMEEQRFVDMLFSVDAVMALTTSEYCMLCGCYESISAGTPLVTSDKRVLRGYFESAVFVDNTPEGISDGIFNILADLGNFKARTEALKQSISVDWGERAQALDALLESY